VGLLSQSDLVMAFNISKSTGPLDALRPGETPR